LARFWALNSFSLRRISFVISPRRGPGWWFSLANAHSTLARCRALNCCSFSPAGERAAGERGKREPFCLIASSWHGPMPPQAGACGHQIVPQDAHQATAVNVIIACGRCDVDLFMNRQPSNYFLTNTEAKLLHLRRFLLFEHICCLNPCNGAPPSQLASPNQLQATTECIYAGSTDERGITARAGNSQHRTGARPKREEGLAGGRAGCAMGRVAEARVGCERPVSYPHPQEP
jgi:hypothetical protein